MKQNWTFIHCVYMYIYYSLFYNNINIKYILKMSTGNCYEYDEVRSLESCVVGVSLAICCWFRAKVKWIFCWVSSARNARSSVSAWLRSWKSFQRKKDGTKLISHSLLYNPLTMSNIVWQLLKILFFKMICFCFSVN